jgi:hypothetical protein
MLLHPLLPHVHGDVRTALLELEEEQSATDSLPAEYQSAPGISAAASDLGFHDSIAGLLLPLFLAAVLLDSSRRFWQREPRPDQRGIAPPHPPPRLLPTIA